MSRVPKDPLIFHITHVDNLPSILQEGGLWCDAKRIERDLVTTNIGHQHIKSRRLHRSVPTIAGTTLGDYVPFNFCPRSVMLCAIHRGHGDYDGGQEAVLHLVSSVSKATALGRPWAFTDRHAELAHALYYRDTADLDEVPWHVMNKRYWAEVKEERQAEFLVHEFFPWTAITKVSVRTVHMKSSVEQCLASASHRPPVTVQPKWYY